MNTLSRNSFVSILGLGFGLCVLTFAASASAQMMMDEESTLGHTAREEAEGKIVWEKFKNGQVTCKDLTDEDFGVLGEYFMGAMMGSAHEAMNEMIEERIGHEGEEEMHVVMGKRLSGCDTSAVFSSDTSGFMPMMWGMPMHGGWGGWGSSSSYGTMMSGFGWYGLGALSFLWNALAILGLIYFVKLIMGRLGRDSGGSQSQ